MTSLLLFTLWSADVRLTYFGDVRPMFERSCYGCHTAGVKMGSLDLETWEGVQRGGNNGTIVVPGKPAESRLYTMLTGEASPAMPMDGRVLPAAQIAVVRQWIAQGAVAGDAMSSPRMPRIYALASAGARVVVGGFRSIEVKEEGKTLAQRAGHAGVVRALAIAKDGSLIAAAGGVPGRQGEVKLWDAAFSLRATLTAHADTIGAVAFSPDGQTLATSSSDGAIKLWAVTTGRELRTLKGHGNALAFTADGRRLISGDGDGLVRIWSVATGERLVTLAEPAESVNALALSPDGRHLAAAGVDGQIRLWRLGEKGGELLQARKAHDGAVLRLAWSADGRKLASTAMDQTIKWWRAADLNVIRSEGGQPDWVYGLAFLPDGTLVAGRFDGSMTTYAAPPE